MLSDGLYRYCWLKIYEHLLSLAVVLLLMGVAVLMQMEYQQQAVTVQAVGPLNPAKLDDLYCWNLHGIWPPNTVKAMSGMGVHDSYLDNRRMLTLIEDGVIHVQFKNGGLSGESISFHPVIPVNDSLGSVHWRAGNSFSDPAYRIQGKDRTSITDSVIMRSLR